jgi:hypothetical protein
MPLMISYQDCSADPAALSNSSSLKGLSKKAIAPVLNACSRLFFPMGRGGK